MPNRLISTDITETEMRNTTGHTRHHATPVDSTKQYGEWTITWLPGRTLTRNEAITAMMLAEEIDSGLGPQHKRWPLIKGFAEELGYTADEVVALLRKAEDQARLAVCTAHNRAASSASLICMPLGMYAGRGSHSSLPAEVRDGCGVRALAELDVALAELAAFRNLLAGEVRLIETRRS